MKALSLWQPWASLVAFGKKKVETRPWTTRYRGPLAIHAALRRPHRNFGCSYAGAHILYLMAAYGIEMKTLPLGSVLCIVNLVDVRRTQDVSLELSVSERAFGNYEDDRYAWFFEDVWRFERPIPAKGNRMLWNWDETRRLT